MDVGAYTWMMVMLKGLALSRTVMILLEIGRHPMTLFTISLCTRKPTPCSCLSSFPLKYTLWPPSVGISPDFFHFISHNPRMIHLYRSISCKSSSTLPAALRVLTFQVAMVMSSLPRSLAPVAHLSFLPWCPTGNAVVVPGRDRSGMDILSFVAVTGGVSWA